LKLTCEVEGGGLLVARPGVEVPVERAIAERGPRSARLGELSEKVTEELELGGKMWAERLSPK
jgi:hypothetical protein